MQLQDYTFAYSLFRIGWVAIALLGCLLLWRRPRPAYGLALVVGLFVVAWAAYRLPLVGSYALPGNDRRVNLGSAACVAAGNAPWNHLQVGVAAIEPFWDVVGATLALFNPAHVLLVYDWLSPLAILFVAFGLYFGLRASRTSRPSPEDARRKDCWERILVVLSVLGLSSYSLSNRAPVLPFFAGNFLLKPGHAAGFGVFAVALGLGVSGAPFWVLGLVLGLLAWVFLLHWAYALPAFVLTELLRPRAERRWARLAAAFGVSFVVALPQIVNLTRDYSPTQKSPVSLQTWDSTDMGRALAPLHWITLDLGLLFVLAIVGAVVLFKRRTALDCSLLGTLVFAFAANVVQPIFTAFGVAPEVDDLHYFLRFAAALAGGAALSALGRLFSQWNVAAAGRGYVLVLAACVPLTFPAYWDPPTMDKFFSNGTQPLPQKIVACADWIRTHTRPDAVVVAGSRFAQLIPALSGRRVLLLSCRAPGDYAARKAVESTLALERDAGKVRQAAARYGVTHLVVDRELREEYAGHVPACSAAFEQVYKDSNVSVFALRPVDDGAVRP